MAGSISYGAMAGALMRGYATASTDTGHKSGGGSFDAEWAIGRPDLVEDYGHRGLHLTTVNGKAITSAFYGTPPIYAYYTGCSKGGQQGLMEAQRYPDDYDGIVAGNPAHDWTRFYVGAHLWYAQATLADPESYIPPDTVGLLADAVNAACDNLDGIEDGILADPRRCDFDPAVLTCGAGDDPTTCLTAKQVAAVNAIWSGGRTGVGEVIYPGLVPGGEAEPGAWERWVTGPERFGGIHFRAADGFFKFMVFEDPDWDFRSFDYDTDLAFALEKVGPMLDARDPDLGPFRARGGKLIVYHGWSDPDISALSSVDYYEQVASLLGAMVIATPAWPRRRSSSDCSLCQGWGTVGAVPVRTSSMPSARSRRGSSRTRHPSGSRRRKFRTARSYARVRCAPIRKWRVGRARAAPTSRPALFARSPIN